MTWGLGEAATAALRHHRCSEHMNHRTSERERTERDIWIQCWGFKCECLPYDEVILNSITTNNVLSMRSLAWCMSVSDQVTLKFSMTLDRAEREIRRESHKDETNLWDVSEVQRETLTSQWNFDVKITSRFYLARFNLCCRECPLHCGVSELIVTQNF